MIKKKKKHDHTFIVTAVYFSSKYKQPLYTRKVHHVRYKMNTWNANCGSHVKVAKQKKGKRKFHQQKLLKMINDVKASCNITWIFYSSLSLSFFYFISRTTRHKCLSESQTMLLNINCKCLCDKYNFHFIFYLLNFFTCLSHCLGYFINRGNHNCMYTFRHVFKFHTNNQFHLTSADYYDWLTHKCFYNKKKKIYINADINFEILISR